jgi:organic radical activating enzyme
MQISEIFYSLQGEGLAAGHPAIFVRLSKCNLNCLGCDTKIKDRIEETTPSSVASRIQNYLKTYPNSRIIFTGGEPLLQPEAIGDVMDRLPGQTFDIETNGTIDDQPELYQRFKIITISPKKDYFNSSKDSIEFIRKWSKISDDGAHNVFFKFVIGNLKWAWNEAEIKNMISESHISATRVWLMPAGDTIDKLNISGKNAWKIAMRLGVNFSDRLHIRNVGK